jgi:hypothetical protein
MSSAQVKMKALVLSRLLMRDISNWTAFDCEWQAAGRVANRRAARSVSHRTTLGADTTDLAIRCQGLLEKASEGHVNRETYGVAAQR